MEAIVIIFSGLIICYFWLLYVNQYDDYKKALEEKKAANQIKEGLLVKVKELENKFEEYIKKAAEDLHHNHRFAEVIQASLKEKNINLDIYISHKFVRLSKENNYYFFVPFSSPEEIEDFIKNYVCEIEKYTDEYIEEHVEDINLNYLFLLKNEMNKDIYEKFKIFFPSHPEDLGIKLI